MLYEECYDTYKKLQKHDFLFNIEKEEVKPHTLEL